MRGLEACTNSSTNHGGEAVVELLGGGRITAMHTQNAHIVVGAWRLWLTAAGRPSTTIYLRTYQLTRFCESHPQPFACSTDDLVSWLGSQKWAPETIRSYRAALVGFYRWALLTGRTDTNPAVGLPVVRVPKRAARPTPEPAVDEAMRRASVRVRLMVDLAGRCGLRRGEICQVNVDDLREDAGPMLVVHGKGGRDRVIPIPSDVAFRIRERAANHTGGWVFGGAIAGHTSARWVGDQVAAVLPTGWGCHTLRHRFATRTYAECHDILVVQYLLGHAKPETTMLYVGLPVDRARIATGWAA